jgi:hypothetical protein
MPVLTSDVSRNANTFAPQSRAVCDDTGNECKCCCNNSPYLVHVQAKPRRAAATRSKFPPRCRLSNKQIIHLPLHASPGAKRHGASRPLLSNGRLCISQKNSATPTPPQPLALPSVTRYSRFNHCPSPQAYQQYFKTTWGLWKALKPLLETVFMYRSLVYFLILYSSRIHVTYNNVRKITS